MVIGPEKLRKSLGVRSNFHFGFAVREMNEIVFSSSHSGTCQWLRTAPGKAGKQAAQLTSLPIVLSLLPAAPPLTTATAAMTVLAHSEILLCDRHPPGCFYALINVIPSTTLWGRGWHYPLSYFTCEEVKAQPFAQGP